MTTTPPLVAGSPAPAPPAGRGLRLALERLGAIRSVLWTGAAVAGAQTIMAVVGLISARVLGADGRGLVTATTTWSAMLAFIAVAGLQSAASVAVASQPEESLAPVLANALAYAVIVGGAITLSAVVVLPDLLSQLGPQARALTAGALVSIPAGLLFEVLASVNLALGRSARYNAARLVGPLVLLASVLALWVSGDMTPGWLVALTVLNTFLGTAVLALRLPWRRMRIETARLVRDLRFGLKTHVGTLMGLANLRLDVMVMAAVVPAAQLGLYSVANSSMIPIEALSWGAALHVLPAVARLTAGGREQADGVRDQLAHIRRTARLHLALAIATGAVIWFAAPIIVRVVGHSFAQATPLIRILIFGYVARAYGLVVTAGAVGMRQPWIGNVSEGVALAVTVVMLPLLLPRHQALGAAITSTCAYASTALVGSLLLHLHRHR